MRRREYYWSLFDSSVKNQIDNLRTDQVEAVFAAIPKNQHSHWMIWRDGLDGWKPFSDFPQLLVSLRKSESLVTETPPPPLAKPIKEKTNTGVREGTKSGTKSGGKTGTKSGKTKPGVKIPQIDQDFEMSQGDFELTLMPQAMIEDRNNFRFTKNFEVRIIAGEKSFENTTTDISLKGMQLKSPLPKGLPRYFNVEIKSGKRSVPVVCSEVKAMDGGPSMRLKIEVNDFTPGLLAMLLSG